jgi:23S rRNA (cytosine1962-C5)-methyltransferase
MISAKPVEDIAQLVRERIHAAIAYRERFVQNTNAYRVIFSEADFLPGLVVDRYNDVLSVQVLTQAMDAADMRQTILSELKEQLQPQAIVERVDTRVRKLEQLPERESAVILRSPNPDLIRSRLSGEEYFDKLRTGSAVLQQKAGSSALAGIGMTSIKCSTEFQMNGIRFVYDALAGQKTGAFLDQRENYAAAAQYARGEALDVFCYQGGFALHLARACEKVTGVDSSRPALEAAEQNANLNGLELEWIEANAFDL